VETRNSETDKKISLFIECAVCLFVFFSFFDKGEGIRNIALYGAFAGWLVLLFTKRVSVGHDLITVSFFVFVLTALLASLFSIEPLNSLAAFRKAMVKPVLLFLIISTHFDLARSLRLGTVFAFAGIALLGLGLHGFLLHQPGVYTSENLVLSADKNKYGFLMLMVMPFFMLFWAKGATWTRTLWGLACIWGCLAVFFTASRGALFSLIPQGALWAASSVSKARLKKALLSIVILFLAVLLSYNLWPTPVKEKTSAIPHDVKTFERRTTFFWEPALEAALKRPVLGWGYGDSIYRDPRPFQSGTVPTWELKGGLHSSYVTTLFHQGVIGLAAHLFMLVASTYLLAAFLKGSRGDERLLGLTLLGVLAGAFIINTVVYSAPLERIAPFLGMSVALLRHRG
jgi:O-antigen ligase